MKKIQASTQFFYDHFDSPLGSLWIVAGKAGLSYLLRTQNEDAFIHEIEIRSGIPPVKNPNHLSRWHTALSRYFSGEKIQFDGPISFLEGSPFQQKVWSALLQIPYGEIRSYQWLGNQLGIKRAGRAIGNACGKNPIPIILPCHRVLRLNGSLGGYTGGIQIKKKLLALEGVL